MAARLPALFLSAFLAAADIAHAQPSGGTIQVEGVWARRAAMIRSGDSKAGSGSSAAYAKLVNRGTESDALVAVASDAATAAEIHESYQESGMSMMRAVARIDVPAGKAVELKPGGYHVMLLNLMRDLKAGETLSLVLHFEKAGRIPVHATVK